MILTSRTLLILSIMASSLTLSRQSAPPPALTPTLDPASPVEKMDVKLASLKPVDESLSPCIQPNSSAPTLTPTPTPTPTPAHADTVGQVCEQLASLKLVTETFNSCIPPNSCASIADSAAQIKEKLAILNLQYESFLDSCDQSDPSAKVSIPDDMIRQISELITLAKSEVKSLQSAHAQLKSEVGSFYNPQAQLRLYFQPIPYAFVFDNSPRPIGTIPTMHSKVEELDKEITEMVEHGTEADPIIEKFDSLFKRSKFQVIVRMVNTAIEMKAINFLRFLQCYDFWQTRAQFHWFQALGYESEWYDKGLWKTYPVSWGENMKEIFNVDKPELLTAALEDQEVVKSLIDLGKDSLLDLVAEYDSISIFKSDLLPISTKDVVDHMKKFAESGSFRILRLVLGAGAVPSGNLHLEQYGPPKKLPKTVDEFKFFMTQGLQYLPMYHFLEKACGEGRTDILGYLYSLDKLLVPGGQYLELAAENDHLNVLKWASEIDNIISYYAIVDSTFKKGQLDTFRFLAEQWGYNLGDFQPVFENAGVDFLEWIESVKPEMIDEKLAMEANFTILKWLSVKHPELLTDRVKETQNANADSHKVMEWIFQTWGMEPLSLVRVAIKGDLDALQWAHAQFGMIPTRELAIVATKAGHLEVLKWIHKINPSCMDCTILVCAMEHNRFEIRKYFDPILDIFDEVLGVDASETRFYYESLEAVKWVYKKTKYSGDIQLKKSFLENAVTGGHLDIVEWALEKGMFSEWDQEYLKLAIKSGHHEVYQALRRRIGACNTYGEYIYLAFQSGNLKMLKVIAEEYPRTISILEEPLTALNYHLRKWLADTYPLKANMENIKYYPMTD